MILVNLLLCQCLFSTAFFAYDFLEYTTFQMSISQEILSFEQKVWYQNDPYV